MSILPRCLFPLFIAQSRFSHQLFNLRDLDWDKRRQILVTGFSNQDHVLQSDAYMFIRNCHRRFDREDLARFKRIGRQSHVVNFHADRVAEAVGFARAITFDKAGRGLLDFRAGEFEIGHDRVHLRNSLLDDVAVLGSGWAS